VAFLKLSVGITLATPLLLAALAVLIPTALLPIPQLRELLLTLQLKIASTLGDSYMLVSRPIEAASIVGQVRRDLEWLAKHCNVVAVVAHSQGGAVAHKALQRGAPSNLGLLFTFGSGLKKLEQLEHLISHGQSLPSLGSHYGGRSDTGNCLCVDRCNRYPGAANDTSCFAR